MEVVVAEGAADFYGLPGVFFYVGFLQDEAVEG